MSKFMMSEPGKQTHIAQNLNKCRQRNKTMKIEPYSETII